MIPDTNDHAPKKRIAPVVLVAWTVLLVPLGFMAFRYNSWRRAERATEERRQRTIQESYVRAPITFDLQRAVMSGDTKAFASAVNRLPNGSPDSGVYATVVETVRNGRLDFLQCWLDHGWPLTYKDRSILSECLGFACTSENPKVVRYLLSKGADPNYLDALLLAVIRKTDAEAEIAILLINAGAKVNRASPFHDTFVPSHIGPHALSTKVSDGDGYGYTLLMLAARNGRADVVKALLAKGADWRQRSRMGQTALDIAEEQEHKEVVALLTEAARRQPKPKVSGPLPKGVYVPYSASALPTQ
jgi:ankyrin repeat protein